MKRSIEPQPWQRKVNINKPRVHKPGTKTIDPALRALVREREGGCCALCGERLPAVWECHHRKLRSRGGFDSAANLLALDGMCHRRVHGHPAWAETHGFMVASHDDLATVPVAIRLTDWRLMTPSGTYRQETP